MDSLFDHYKKTGFLHHAHLIEGAYDEVAPTIIDALARHIGIEVKNNPDLIVAFHDSLGINEARTLSDMQTRHPFGGARKFFIIGAKLFTSEAQNALLKTLEEPTERTHFFLIFPRAEMLLPTLRSRVLVVRGANTEAGDEAKKLAEKFLGISLEDRFTLAKKLAEHKKGESADRDLIRRMLDHIERILYTRMAGLPATAYRSKETVGRPVCVPACAWVTADRRTRTGRWQAAGKPAKDIFRELYQAKTYLADRGSSPKMLLEHIAIVIPPSP